MVYTDGIHLIADSVKELHNFAQRIGLKRCWFESHRTKHYDLMLSPSSREMMLNKAIEQGAIKVSDRELINIKNKNKK